MVWGIFTRICRRKFSKGDQASDFVSNYGGSHSWIRHYKKLRLEFPHVQEVNECILSYFRTMIISVWRMVTCEL